MFSFKLSIIIFDIVGKNETLVGKICHSRAINPKGCRLKVLRNRQLVELTILKISDEDYGRKQSSLCTMFFVYFSIPNKVKENTKIVNFVLVIPYIRG